MKKLGFAAALFVASLGAIGCNSDYSMEAKDLTGPPIPADVTGDRMDLPAGIAVGFRAIPKRGGGELDADTEVDFVSDDPSIVDVASTTEARRYVVWGVGEGTTTITMRVGGADQLTIPVTIRPQ